jgi:hypothetical protein
MPLPLTQSPSQLSSANTVLLNNSRETKMIFEAMLLTIVMTKYLKIKHIPL